MGGPPGHTDFAAGNEGHSNLPDTTSRAASALTQLPTVTVLTPTFQRCEMLRLTLASVRLQTQGDVEHIVIDGGSTDGTVDLLRRAEERWGVRWVSERDGGMYEALNKGLALARGSVIGWVNSDDWLLPWTVGSALETMSSAGVPTAVFGDVALVDLGGTDSSGLLYGSFNRTGLATVSTLAQPTVFWPRSATNTIGPLDTDTYRQIADCDYWLRLSTVIPFRKSRELMAVEVNHQDTKRASLSLDILAEFERLRAQYRPDNVRLPWERVKNALRWRRELGRLVTGRDWPAARASELIDLPLNWMSPIRAIARFGPQRRHPMKDLRIGIEGFVNQLRATADELDF